jgi:hypothetical protein
MHSDKNGARIAISARSASLGRETMLYKQNLECQMAIILGKKLILKNI